MKMNMKKIMMVISAICLAACSSNEEVPAIAKISGTWEIVTVHYQSCNNGVCQDNFVLDFENSGLTFEIRSDSVFYYPFVNNPEIERFKVVSYSDGLLKLQNTNGIWDYLISDQQESSMKVTAIVPVVNKPPDKPDFVLHDVFYLKR
jgi:hypothetical protein